MGDRVPVIVGDLVPVDLGSVWPMKHLLRCPSRAGVLIKCHLLLEEDPLDLVQSFLRAIILMALLGALIGWFQLKVVCPKAKRGEQGSHNYRLALAYCKTE